MVVQSLYYENSEGDTIDFFNFPMGVENVDDLMGKEWEFSVSENVSRNYSRVSNIYRTSYEKKINVQVFADSEEEFAELVDSIDNITDIDTQDKTPGKLWMNGYYLECFCSAAASTDFDDDFFSVDMEVTFYSANPFWLKEVTLSLYKVENLIESNTDLDYSYDYAHDYKATDLTNIITNEGYIDTDFQVTIYGPTINPWVNIGGNVYEVDVEVEEDYKLIFNSLTRKIYLENKNGTQTNVYSYREPRIGFFSLLPGGQNEVTWDGTFNIDITFFIKRSMPRLGG